jgi:hypothetical protein
MKRSSRIGWILVGFALREAVRILWDAAIGRPGRIVQHRSAPAPVRPDRVIHWPWPPELFDMGAETEARSN